MTDWPTTRRYPRTLAEAFPCERESRAIEHYRPITYRPWWIDALLSVLLACGIGLGLALYLIEWWTT
jgi:hypothetical protein